jgi:hypothetical protein
MKDKEKFYSEMIGGDPKKASNYWGDSSQDEKMAAFTFLSNEISGNKKVNTSNAE